MIRARCRGARGFRLIKRDIREDPVWAGLYGLRIPVLTNEQGRVIVEGGPGLEELERALSGVEG
jgi:hypothetical protein